jgi:hypothetical protein
MLKRIALAAALLTAAAFAQDSQPPGDPAALLSEASAALGRGEISAARKAGEKAVQALAIKQGEAIRATLPAPFDGWTVQDGDTANMGMIAMGGGITVDRTYQNAEGQDVRIEIMADSDMVAEMGKMFSDAAMVGALGLQPVTIAGETAYVDPSDGKLTFLVDARSMFTISGSADQATRKSYAENINFAAFRAIK